MAIMRWLRCWVLDDHCYRVVETGNYTLCWCTECGKSFTHE